MVDMKNNVHNKKKVADLKDELDKFYKKKFYKKLEEEYSYEEWLDYMALLHESDFWSKSSF